MGSVADLGVCCSSTITQLRVEVGMTHRLQHCTKREPVGKWNGCTHSCRHLPGWSALDSLAERGEVANDSCHVSKLLQILLAKDRPPNIRCQHKFQWPLRAFWTTIVGLGYTRPDCPNVSWIWPVSIEIQAPTATKTAASVVNVPTKSNWTPLIADLHLWQLLLRSNPMTSNKTVAPSLDSVKGVSNCKSTMAETQTTQVLASIVQPADRSWAKD